jgi:hypothetical protein
MEYHQDREKVPSYAETDRGYQERVRKRRRRHRRMLYRETASVQIKAYRETHKEQKKINDQIYYLINKEKLFEENHM